MNIPQSESDDLIDLEEESDEEDDDVKESLEKIEEVEPPPQKKRKWEPNRPKDLYKPPTTEELNNLKEAETLFLSSLFRMQSDELLKEVKLKEKWKPLLDAWLLKLKVILESQKAGGKHDLCDQDWLKKNEIQVPIVQEPYDVKGVFLFEPPTSINVVGSYRLDLACLPDFVVDVVIEIPKSFWQHGDFLNHRYHRKRALYLACIASGLRNDENVEEMHFTYHHGDHMRPTLLVKPAGRIGKHCKVQILPCPPEDFFKLSRLVPARNNVRPSWYFGDSRLEDDIPTPHYNSSMLVDLVSLTCLRYQQEHLKDSNSLRDGILLLKVWLRQRGLSDGHGGFSGFIVTMLVLYLVGLRKISRMMSSYQVMRNTLLALSEMNWTERGIGLSQTSEESFSDFHNHFDVVFIDASGFANFCANMTKSTFENARHEARLCMKILDGNFPDSFEALFMKPVLMVEKFDHLVYLEDICGSAEMVERLHLASLILDRGGNIGATVLPKIIMLLQKGLGKRLLLIGHHLENTNQWSVSEAPPNLSSQKRLGLGILVNPEFATSVLEKGPQADAPEAKDFRDFWGDKSELRRFQDGTICEAVAFLGSCLAEKRLVIEKMAKYILQKHAAIPEGSVIYTSSPLDPLLTVNDLNTTKKRVPYGTGDEAIVNVMQSYTSLAKALHKVNGLPLSITSVQGISPVFRFSEVFPPLPKSISVWKNLGVSENCMTVKKTKKSEAKPPPFVQPLDVIVHLEASGKWPDNVEAIRHLKASFNIELAKVLQSDFDMMATPSVNHINVLKDGYVFRIVVASTKEVMLLKQVKSGDGMVKFRETEESQQLHYRISIMPQLTSTLHGLQQQHNLYGISCRLAKRWVSSHLLSDHVPEICVELLMAYLFLNPHPFSVPGSGVVAFLRFLNLVATHSWKTSPLIVNTNGELTQDDYTNVLSHFMAHRPTLPPMFISTPFDKENSVCSRKSPSGLILHRMVQLAGASLCTLKEQLRNPTAADFKQIFRPPTDAYDVIIHLKPQMIPKEYMGIDAEKGIHVPTFQKRQKKKSETMPVVGYDPVQCYLKELRESYEEFALFFYDCYGGSFIAVAWKPKAFQHQPFKVSHINARMAVPGNEADIIPNVEAILENFSILGSGIVKQIETKTTQWVID